ncbi:methyltransferase-like 26 [Patella vulgata]|uniref:methyltransferase-like 26 n=1 Tax=Patella vulgata TaxID=6465 RepID=UPI00218036A3|nr:methyltransferase-like 26 [Patella vulgata]
MNISKRNYMDVGAVARDSSMIMFPAADRNKEAILDVLEKYFPPKGGVSPATENVNKELPVQALEISSGTGQHVIYFASHLPQILWQPSEYDKDYIKSISAHIKHSGVTNVLPPVQVDISQPVEDWMPSTITLNSCDLLLNVNLIHISPWQCAIGLMKAAGKLLKKEGFLFMYGPMSVHGVISPESNVRFDRSLRSQNSSWGLRDIDDIESLATENQLKLHQVVDMPANNKTLVFVKQ